MTNPFIVDMTMKLKEKQNELKEVKNQISLLEEYERGKNNRKPRSSVNSRAVKKPPQEDFTEEYEPPTEKRRNPNNSTRVPQTNPVAIQFKPKVQTYQDNLTRMILGCR